MRRRVATGHLDTGRKARFDTWDAAGAVNAASMPSVAEGSRLSPVANPTTDWRRAGPPVAARRSVSGLGASWGPGHEDRFADAVALEQDVDWERCAERAAPAQRQALGHLRTVAGYLARRGCGRGGVGRSPRPRRTGPAAPTPRARPARRYLRALKRLTPRERRLIVGRAELGYSFKQLA